MNTVVLTENSKRGGFLYNTARQFVQLDGGGTKDSTGIDEFDEENSCLLTVRRESGMRGTLVKGVARVLPRYPGVQVVRMALMEDVVPEEFLTFLNDRVAILNSLGRKITIPEVDFLQATPEELMMQRLALNFSGKKDQQPGEFAEICNWFKLNGPRKNWIMGNRVDLLLKNLLALKQGEQLDVNIWNCIEFSFSANGQKFLSCNIDPNLRCSITPYFIDQILKIRDMLLGIGNTINFNILLPSSEALDAQVFNFLQSQEERIAILEEARANLTGYFGQSGFNVLRWDEYLKQKGVTVLPEEYTSKAIADIKADPDAFQEFARGVLEDFAQWGADFNVPEEEIIAGQTAYMAMYKGEGMASADMTAGKNCPQRSNILWLNFEEGRVGKQTYLGAGGNLCWITPVSTKQINAYYQWKKSVIGV